MKMLSLGSTLLIFYTFATVLFCTYMGWSTFLSLFGPWRVRALTLCLYACVTFACQGEGGGKARASGAGRRPAVNRARQWHL